MSRALVQATWEDAPHLDPKTKADLWASIPPFQRAARTKGTPQLGSGAIYPVDESEIVCKPFQLPDWYRRSYGFDVGWNRTAAIWSALDPEADVLYLYSEHYRGVTEPPVHADAIRQRGLWIPGVIDPASRGRNQTDGDRLMQIYLTLGLDITKADNSVEAGIYEVLMRLSSGRLRVFDTLQAWLSEFRIYRRDEHGKVIKLNDHLMDATRYMVMSGLARAMAVPADQWAIKRKTLHQIDYDPFAEGWKLQHGRG